MKKSIINTVLSALFAGIICIISSLCIVTPMGVPLTLQALAVALCGYILGPKWGVAAVAVYIAIGSAGMPVFAGFKGGVHHLFSLTGGFILGFLLLTVFCGLSFKVEKVYIKVLFGILGVISLHLFGCVWLSFVSKTPILAAFLTSSLPFLLKDILCVLAAFLISRLTTKIFNKTLR